MSLKAHNSTMTSLVQADFVNLQRYYFSLEADICLLALYKWSFNK